jgi:hypothetical protein
MLEVIPITPVATVSLPLSRLGPDHVRFFAIVTSTSERQGDRRAASIATAIENLALEEHQSSPARGTRATVHAWLAAYVRRLQEHLHRERADALAGIGICVGIATTSGNRVSLSLAPAGNIAAFAIAINARRAPTAIPIIEPPTVASLRFSHTIDGTIGPHDVLIVGGDGLASDDVRRSCALAFTRDVHADAIAKLRNLLPRGTHAAAITGTSTAPPRSQQSMDLFLATATSTERFLTPRLGPMLRQYVAQLHTTTALVMRKRSRRAPRRQLLPIIQHAARLVVRTVIVAARSLGAMAADGLRLLSIAAIRIVRVLGRLYRSAVGGKTSGVTGGRTPDFEEPGGAGRKKSGVEEPVPSVEPAASDVGLAPTGASGEPATGAFGRTWHALRSAVTTKTTGFRAWYANLPATSQRLFLLTVLFAGLFLISTAMLVMRRTTELSVTTYNATITKIEELRSVAEARLLFGDRTAAREALREAEAALAMLPRSSRARRERAEVLDREIRAALDRARLVTRIQQPLRVAHGGEGEIPFTEIGTLSVVGNQLAAGAADGSAIAVIDPRGGAIKSYDLSASKLPSRPLRALVFDDRSIMLIDAGAHTIRVDVRSGTATAMTIEQPPPGIRDAALFQGRLYLLHTDGAITRRAKTTGGFGRGTVWLQASNAPSNIQRLFVAGPVFLTSGEGGAAVFFAGRRRDVELLKNVDPPLSTTALLTAPPDQEVLYLGDPTEGRVIALKPNGELIGQVQSDTFRNMADLASDPTGAALYVLASNEISVIVPPKSGGG